jgi:hypothetical protein
MNDISSGAAPSKLQQDIQTLKVGLNNYAAVGGFHLTALDNVFAGLGNPLER